ncbi:SAM-dependent methyltransferase [Frankia gtarii]|uniref:SAM-dependent methyltransferase n=1 Tax=Frankia gtarii TaxID=2950102 RepID=UPI0034D52915
MAWILLRRLHLAGNVGIRQLLDIDIGIGIPASPNLHEVVQQRPDMSHPGGRLPP